MHVWKFEEGTFHDWVFCFTYFTYFSSTPSTSCPFPPLCLLPLFSISSFPFQSSLFLSPCLSLCLWLSPPSTLLTGLTILHLSFAQVFLLADLVSHAVIGCRQICEYFNISCFTIPYPPPMGPPDAAISRTFNGSEPSRGNEATSTGRSKGDTWWGYL